MKSAASARVRKEPGTPTPAKASRSQSELPARVERGKRQDCLSLAPIEPLLVDLQMGFYSFLTPHLTSKIHDPKFEQRSALKWPKICTPANWLSNRDFLRDVASKSITRLFRRSPIGDQNTHLGRKKGVIFEEAIFGPIYDLKWPF